MSSTALFRPETGIVSAKHAQTGPSSVSTSLGTISVRVTRDLESLKDLWEAMQSVAPCTAAQTYDAAWAWAEHVLKPDGRDAVVVVGYGSDGTPLFLWPFEIETRFGLRILKWLGQDHANYNMGLFSPEAARALDRQDISRLLREAGRQAGAAAATFAAQPVSWDGLPNPLALLSHQRAPNSGYAVALGDFDELYKSRFSKRSRYALQRKEHRLAEMGRLEYGWAETREEKLAVLEAFLVQKAKQFAAMGVTDVFDGDTSAFYRALALLDGDNPSRLRLGYVKLDGAILATFSGFICHDRLSVALSSLAEGETQRQSPGALLLRHQIRGACEAGLAYYDLGVGQARHKDDWCNTVYELFDSFIAFKPHGLLLSLPLAGAARLKRYIKANHYLWSFAQAVRKRLFSRDG